jgi:hypothetical protein
MQLFWSQLKANHVLPRVLIFDFKNKIIIIILK